MTHDQVIKLIVAVVMAIVIIHCIKKGFKKGFLKELGSSISLILSLVCIFLILLLYTAFKDKTYGTAIVVVITLVLIGVFVKLGRCIGRGLMGITELLVISWIDKTFGAVLGLGEAVLVIYIFNQIMTDIGKMAYVVDIPALIHK